MIGNTLKIDLIGKIMKVVLALQMSDQIESGNRARVIKNIFERIYMETIQ